MSQNKASYDINHYDQETKDKLEGWQSISQKSSFVKVSEQEQKQFDEARASEALSQKRSFILGGKITK